MRPPLLGSGLLVMATGAAFYFLELPIFSVWGFPMVVGGGIMSAVAFWLPEGRGQVRPPDGYRFCVFCTSLVPIGGVRCSHCNGIQPQGGA
ncbi:MAG: hypothetical protein OK438_07355 [Thaumarchaeota archaeon]|nr:hypothetical protein [Nitrososphaerota archaeon]